MSGTRYWYHIRKEWQNRGSKSKAGKWLWSFAVVKKHKWGTVHGSDCTAGQYQKLVMNAGIWPYEWETFWLSKLTETEYKKIYLLPLVNKSPPKLFSKLTL